MRIVCVLLASSVVFGQSAAPDLVIHHAKIFTGIAGRPFATAIAIRGDRIAAIGTDDAVLTTADASTRRIDGEGRVVIPGFNDAHIHINPQPPATAVPLNGQEPAWEEVQSALTDALAKSATGPMLTAAIGGRVLEDRRATREALDRISAARPIKLCAWTGHGCILNSAALTLYGIGEDQADPPGGSYGRDASRRLDGRLYEYAGFRLSLAVDEDRQTQVWQATSRQLAAWGITSIQNMTFEADRDRTFFGRHPQSLRVRTMPTIADWRDASRPPTEPHQAVKIIVDGTPVERYAAMRQPYADDQQTSGRMNLSEAELCGAMHAAAANGRQPILHVVGDRATTAALDCMDADGRVDWPSLRVRFEHGDMVTPELFARLKKLGVIVVQNPAHFTIGDVLETRWGRERANASQNAGSLIAAGLRFALGSDGQPNPFLNIMFACARPGRASEALTREQAVEAYTHTAALAEFAEGDKGTLEQGKLADLAMLSQDIFTVPLPELPRTQSVLTIVGGKVIYEPAAR